jgi:2-polyprenyl-6-methoxyphenol hydroxylase-like FAD-dependent oxidoreductase
MADEMTDARRTYDCCVIGGGPTGLLAAVALGVRGHSVLVLERQTRAELDTPRTGPVRATVLQPATLSVFASLGLLDDLVADSAQIVGGQVVVDGQVVLSYDYGDVPGCPVAFALSTPLAVTTEVLRRRIDALPNVELAFGAEVRALTQPDGRRFELEAVLDGRPARIAPGFIVAADGKLSATRAQSGIPSRTVEFPQTYFDVNVPVPDDWAGRIRVYFGPHGYLMVSPRAGDQLVLAWITDAETAQRFAAGPVAPFVELLAQAVPVLADSLRTNIQSWDDVRRTRHSAVRAEQWVEQNLVLLGDAAHGLHAFGGQGLNIALQDAACVAHAISASLHAGTTAPVKEFESVRKPYVDAFQDLQQAAVGAADASRRPGPDNLPEMQALVLGQAEIRPLLVEATAELARTAPVS